ncbi:serine/threonine-protein kinase ATM-like [Anopheles merus]|uniref:serine/threonine-protein kinase ATM-like n=1 Tax=Anopheles merus TaxID=30066 RepID=UPI001BE48B3B|nr:serine/threonine-protein kinase ATM-like [Anopheles merus]
MTKRDPLGQLESLDLIHCPTVELPVLKTGNYRSHIVGIRRWDAKVIVVGGINAPKKLACLCLNGTKRTQLLKGKDDMRQDAVMQQVFGIMNILLRHDKETAHRKLSVRTYKVVPLSRQSGILEWCNNTMPIVRGCFPGMPVSAAGPGTDSGAEKVFQLPEAGVWFERQQNYIKSVAASSMIGYVLGIGDRHVQTS